MNETARVTLVGITPGWHQMRLAYTVARDPLRGVRLGAQLHRVQSPTRDGRAVQALRLRCARPELDRVLRSVVIALGDPGLDMTGEGTGPL